MPQITVNDKSQLSKLQRRFNNTIQKINALKNKLAARQAVLEQARARMESELRPLILKIVESRVELVKLLDRSYNLAVFKKREKDKIAYLIEDISFQLIENYGVEEVIALHDKYAPATHAEVVAQEEEAAKEITANMFRMFGVEVDADDFDDVEQLQSKMQQQLEEEDQERVQQRAGQKKTKAQLAKEEKMKTEMQNISKASRRVYTNLVKLLHPDKEQDEEVKVWKEEAMKQVTQAYEKDDFFELLRLQMAYIAEHEKQIDQLPEDQLKYYLKLLQEQYQELEEQEYLFNIGPDAGFYFQYGGTPKQMDQKFGTAKNDLKKELKQLKQDLQHLEEPAYLRAFLKEVRFS